MKNSKIIDAVNKQEDEDAETYILHPAHAVNNTKQNNPPQSADSYKERIKQSIAGNPEKNTNRSSNIT